MTFDQLLTFLWVARLGGVRRAAEQMHLSQPAVSARLGGLEEALRVTLFERSGRGVVLTKEGELLKGYAEQIFFIREEIQRRVADPSGVEGFFRVGCSETIAQSWLSRFLERFSEVYPRVSLELTVDISRDLREALMGRQLDLALLMGPVSDCSVDNVDLPAFPLAWYRKAGGGDTDLAAVPVISYARQTRPYRDLSREMVRRYGPGVRVYSSTSLATSLQLVSAGVGVGPFPQALAPALVGAGEIEPFDPGWRPPDLHFTASFLTEPRNALAEEGAALAAMVGRLWQGELAAEPMASPAAG